MSIRLAQVWQHIWPPRTLPAKFFFLFCIALTVSLVHLLLPYDIYTAASPALPLVSHGHTGSGCPPRTWAAGSWVPKPAPTNRTVFTAPSDAFEFLGLEGCASSREVYWHLAADNEKLWSRFPGVSSWEWAPPSDCAIRDFDPEELVRDLVEHGGWLLVGDSVTENHFFSLSCLLYPHVRATPDYTASSTFDRAWPQHFYLDPSSPIVKTIRFPPGFDIALTPLVTFRRVDLLLEPSRLDVLYHRLHPDSSYVGANKSLFSDEAVWNIPPSEYIGLFTAPLPHGNYATMVVSTGGHWTTTLLAGLRDRWKYKSGIWNVVSFFGEAMEAWADEVQTLLDYAEASTWRTLHTDVEETQLGRGGSAPKQVIVRAYIPGHEHCHSSRTPVSAYKPGLIGSYNWNQIGDFNRAFETILDSPKYPAIHFLPIDRPALLRPDAHTAGDCLHFMTGAGVLEGWTHYIWHYVTTGLHNRLR